MCPMNEWRRQWQPTPILLPGKSHGWRSLVGYGPWGSEESDMTEQLHFHFALPCIGEGNGNPLQYSWLENPRDRGVWWAAVIGVTQSQTRMTWLSSSSNEQVTSVPNLTEKTEQSTITFQHSKYHQRGYPKGSGGGWGGGWVSNPA